LPEVPSPPAPRIPAATEHKPQASAAEPPGGLFDPTLWGQSTGAAVLRRLHVIGPYPTEDFFRRVRDQLNPQEVLVVVDDGCNLDEVDRIGRVFNDKPFKVRYASCVGSGLVHAKLYLAEWESATAPFTVRRLLWGSLNATRTGFENNAETASFTTVDPNQDVVLLPYFRTLWQKDSGVAKRVDTLLPGGVRLLLPAFRFTARREEESFESWIQSGRLCHKYEPDQTFARLSVTLRKPLPHDAIQSLFSDADLRMDTDSRVFQYPYLGEAAKGAGKTVPRWRARYFVETWLGFWTSEACYQAYQESFTAKNQEQRKEVLSRIRLSNKRDHSNWTSEFVRRLHHVLAGMKKQGANPTDYFYLKKRVLDTNHYIDNADNQLEAHRKRAQNKVFEERFTRGYVFPPLPRFRGTEAVEGGSFNDFVNSWCESVVSSMTKSKCVNLMVRTLREQFGGLHPAPEPSGGEELREAIDTHWKRIGPKLKAFHKRSRPQ
jgi:hypothetical protein